ncbi:MAG: PEP-CTERM sorting domain-containing protein, partial [Colwellia sp.]
VSMNGISNPYNNQNGAQASTFAAPILSTSRNCCNNNIRLHTGLINVPPSTVPEPSTLAIFALGMIGLASRRFKKQSI